MNSIWIHFPYREFTINALFHDFILNLLSLSRVQFEHTIFCAISLSIHYLFREFNFNKLSVFRIQYGYTIFIANFFLNTLSISRFQFESTIFIANSLWIDFFSANLVCMYFWFHDITMNSISGSRIIFVDLDWINYRFREFNFNLLSL